MNKLLYIKITTLAKMAIKWEAYTCALLSKVILKASREYVPLPLIYIGRKSIHAEMQHRGRCSTQCSFGVQVPSICILLLVLWRKCCIDLNHSPSMCCIGLVSSRTGVAIPAMIWTQSRLIWMVRPSNGEYSLVCCINAVIWAIDCSAYRLLIPMPPCSAGQ